MNGQRARVLRCTLFLGASIGALLVQSSAQATAPQSAATIDIRPQPVASALRELASETGANVLFTPDSVSGLQASGVTGRMSPDEAARRLVAGTPLQVVSQADGAIIANARTR